MAVRALHRIGPNALATANSLAAGTPIAQVTIVDRRAIRDLLGAIGAAIIWPHVDEAVGLVTHGAELSGSSAVHVGSMMTGASVAHVPVALTTANHG